MEINKLSTCCFIGHRKIDITDDLINRLERIIENLITDKNINTFLFGSKSEFNWLCLKIVTNLRKKYPYIKRIYVRDEFPYIDENYKAYLLESYEDTYYPERIKNSGRAAYIERNYEMVDNSVCCVIYYSEGYMPCRRKNSSSEVVGYQPESGTKRVYDYAEKKGVQILNVIK